MEPIVKTGEKKMALEKTTRFKKTFTYCEDKETWDLKIKLMLSPKSLAKLVFSEKSDEEDEREGIQSKTVHTFEGKYEILEKSDDQNKNIILHLDDREVRTRMTSHGTVYPWKKQKKMSFSLDLKATVNLQTGFVDFENQTWMGELIIDPKNNWVYEKPLIS